MLPGVEETTNQEAESSKLLSEPSSSSAGTNRRLGAANRNATAKTNETVRSARNQVENNA